MNVKFLDENLKTQTKENLKELRQILKPVRYDRRANLLGEMLDGKLGLYCVSGKDEDYSKVAVFSARRDSNMADDILFCAYTYPDINKESIKFDLIAKRFEDNPIKVRNFLFKFAKVLESNDFPKILNEFSKGGRLSSIWFDPVRYGFTKLHYSLGHLPKGYRMPW